MGGREHRLSPASRTENARNARNARDTEFRSQQWPVLSRGSRFSGLFGCAVCLGGASESDGMMAIKHPRSVLWFVVPSGYVKIAIEN